MAGELLKLHSNFNKLLRRSNIAGANARGLFYFYSRPLDPFDIKRRLSVANEIS
jgi:hypothetical protein